MKLFAIRYSLRPNSGYIAVVSAVIITLVITLLSLAASNNSFLGRFDTQSAESKVTSYQLAQGCLDHARLRLAMGLYSGNETVDIGSYSCHIYPITTSGLNKIIQVDATVDNKTTNLKLTINALSYITVSLEELNSL